MPPEPVSAAAAPPRGPPDLPALARRLLAEGPALRTLATPRRVRILFAGRYVADTTAARYVWEHPRYPWYYVPFAVARLAAGGRSTDRVVVFRGRRGTTTDDDDDDDDGGDDGNAGSSSPLRGLVRVEFGAADAWFEEDERIYVHPRDPFKRVDILRSARPVRVLVRRPAAGREHGGQEEDTAAAAVVVARAEAGALHLHETGPPVRYYVPPTAVDWSLLRASETTSECPYKGVARYYHVVLRGEGAAEETVLEDLVWYYRDPTHESAQIAGALCFYNEKVDIELDGKMLERPKTHFA